MKYFVLLMVLLVGCAEHKTLCIEDCHGTKPKADPECQAKLEECKELNRNLPEVTQSYYQCPSCPKVCPYFCWEAKKKGS